MEENQYTDLLQWLAENETSFQPPVCNKMLHGKGQLKVFFVGGPNQRKDFHLEEGEEFFYQRKGDMLLVVMEQGKFKDIHIREGEVFLLPGKIPHSPRRFENTLGLVIERERKLTELDALRYFVDESTEILYEKWFHCEDLGSQLGPMIRQFFASEQCRTGKPIPGQDIEADPPWEPDSSRKLDSPFDLELWLEEHAEKLAVRRHLPLFSSDYKSKVLVLAPGAHEYPADVEAEMLVWQLKGKSLAIIDGAEHRLPEDTTFLVKKDQACELNIDDNGIAIVIKMTP